MKFGGTSVGDANRIEKVAEIIRNISLENNVVVVVSAMAGVTNKLIEAAKNAEAGNYQVVSNIFAELYAKHETAANLLVRSSADREAILRKIRELLYLGDHLCQGTLLLGELTLRALDSIASLGERLSAPLVAAALNSGILASEAIDATELVVTDAHHGSAEPQMDATRLRCEARLGPLLQAGIITVVTGYIGATPEGAVTTLGRGGSDFSATILGAALDADEVIIWTDVDGILTADPRLIPEVQTIPEISYREAAELAFFGAKVLHPKTLRPVMESDIPVWIRNSFAPERTGTKITREGSPNGGGAKALSAMNDVSLITVGGPGALGVQGILGRTFTATAAVNADVLLVLHCSSQNDLSFVVPAALAGRAIDALRCEFAREFAHEQTEHINVVSAVAIVAVVGENMRETHDMLGRTFSALSRENVNVMAVAQGSSEYNISFVVQQKDMQSALMTIHREFQLDLSRSEELRVKTA
jgi:aspartate kinase